VGLTKKVEKVPLRGKDGWGIAEKTRGALPKRGIKKVAMTPGGNMHIGQNAGTEGGSIDFRACKGGKGKKRNTNLCVCGRGGVSFAPPRRVEGVPIWIKPIIETARCQSR